MRIMGLSLLNPEFPSPAGRFLLFTTKVMNRTFPSKIYLIFFLDTANLEHNCGGGKIQIKQKNKPLTTINIDTNYLTITRTYKIHSIKFRDKQNGWSQYSMTIELE